MSKTLILLKLIWLISGLRVSGYEQGVGAYYHQVSLRGVCERRVEHGWLPRGTELDCAHPCLAAAITTDAAALGTFVLVDLPGGSLHI